MIEEGYTDLGFKSQYNNVNVSHQLCYSVLSEMHSREVEMKVLKQCSVAYLELIVRYR